MSIRLFTPAIALLLIAWAAAQAQDTPTLAAQYVIPKATFDDPPPPPLATATPTVTKHPS